jgi:hypothetical protein
MQWFRTHSVSLGDGRTVHIAWDETHYVAAESEDAALTALAARSLPEGYLATWHRGGLEADDFWVVTREDTPGVRGIGGTPEQAVEDFEAAKKLRWYPERFNTMVGLVRMAIQNSEETDRREIEEEFVALIQDIRAGTFKYEG